jgi:DNA-binding transcriptional ArsR family regulator
MGSWRRRLRRKYKAADRGTAGQRHRRPGWPFWDRSRQPPDLKMPVTLAFAKGLSPARRLLLAALAADAWADWTPLDPDDLARRLGSGRRAILQDLDKLEADGLVATRPTSTTGREYRITDQGESIMLGPAGPSTA